jgi:hypothetical protein
MKVPGTITVTIRVDVSRFHAELSTAAQSVARMASVFRRSPWSRHGIYVARHRSARHRARVLTGARQKRGAW